MYRRNQKSNIFYRCQRNSGCSFGSQKRYRRQRKIWPFLEIRTLLWFILQTNSWWWCKLIIIKIVIAKLFFCFLFSLSLLSVLKDSLTWNLFSRQNLMKSFLHIAKIVLIWNISWTWLKHKEQDYCILRKLKFFWKRVLNNFNWF